MTQLTIELPDELATRLQPMRSRLVEVIEQGLYHLSSSESSLKRKVISIAFHRLIKERANGQCESCLIHDDDVFLPHESDHIRVFPTEGGRPWPSPLTPRTTGGEGDF